MEPKISSKNIPTVFIIFGATGDLMGKKIVPALFHLYKKGKFPRLFKIIGFSRRDLLEEQFIDYVRELLQKHGQNEYAQEDVENFLSYFMYQKGDFDEGESYKTLASRMGIIDGGWNVCSNKLFYLAVPPQYYKNISEHLAHSGLTIPCGADEGWTRVIVEKPFGKDLKSAEELDLLLSKLFKEEQIYRIDHYLAKEMLQNILVFRFANSLFEDIWSNKYIERIDIRTRESIGAEGRGPFYDGLGALRDVGQNHLLQMLALVTMENPGVLDSEHVRKKRAELLSTLGVLTKDEIKKETFRAQYKGYRDIEGVAPNSNTETYFKVIGSVQNPRWTGVKITLEAGKRLPLKKEIVITFKHPDPCVCPPGKHLSNKVIFSLEPKEGITIEFWSKKPGLEYKFVKRNLNFVNRRVNERVQYVEEYEKLLLDCISGNQILFLSTPEIATCWAYIDPIVEAWQENVVPLHFYKPDSREAINAAAKIGEELPGKKLKKEIGIVGLGKMGSNVARRLTTKGWTVIAYNRTESVTKSLESEGITGAYSLEEFVSKLKAPRSIITLLPSGAPTDEMLDKLLPLLGSSDVIIEMANSFYKDTKRRAEKVQAAGRRFIDVGISGGPGGALNGACLMVGGDKKTFEYLEPLFKDMARPGAVAHFEGIGAGHFAKMVHNGIEYGMMQSIAEGFTILKESEFEYDLEKVTEIYNNGSVVESRLVGLLQESLKKYGNNLDALSGAAGFTGEGEWTAKVAEEMGIAV
ncbi:MAG: glucose-6-phosphate dehydrogenase, partial [Candidatus Levyibacteriota bacterium]